MSEKASKSTSALWMAGWLSLTVVIAIAAREALRDTNVFAVMEARSVIGLALLLPIVYRGGGFAALRTLRLRQHIARNVVHYGAQLGWFFALTLIPIGQVVAIEFTMPIWTAIMAAGFLGERLTPWKIVAIVLGLVGVVTIVRPAMNEINPGQLSALAAAVGFAISAVIVKSLTRAERPLAVIFWMLLIQSIVGFLPTLCFWSWPSAHAFGWMMVIAFCGTFSHYCFASAMRHADVTVVVPMDFLRVPLTATAGWLIFSEPLDIFTGLGAALILIGNLLNLRQPTAQLQKL